MPKSAFLAILIDGHNQKPIIQLDFRWLTWFLRPSNNQVVVGILPYITTLAGRRSKKSPTDFANEAKNKQDVCPLFQIASP